jgi:cytochrome oxidase Cu insertion factor (SCO1/SenC/PrrC family)
MTNAQKWATIILSFVLALILIAGGYAYGISKSVENILSAPAVTSEINVSGEFIIEGKDIDGVPVSLRIDNIQGKFNSKIIDLILLAINAD